MMCLKHLSLNSSTIKNTVSTTWRYHKMELTRSLISNNLTMKMALLAAVDQIV